MRLTKENKQWMRIALYLGEDNMILFSESRYEWIAEYECFWRLVEEHGIKQAKYIAQAMIYSAMDEIQHRMGLQ